MQDVLDRVRKVVSEFDPKQRETRIERVEQLVHALTACRSYVDANGQTDRGCAQRLAREVDEILCALPQFSHLSDKHAIASRHTRKLAEDHLAELERQLKQVLEEDKKEKQKELKDWVNKHPVFGKLRRVCSKKGLAKDTYVLLFEKTPEGTLQLVPRGVEEHAILTRFRPVSFAEDAFVHKVFSADHQIVGAAVISERELIELIGELPEPAENKDHLQTLLAISNELSGKPARDFVDKNETLKALHELARKRRIPKDAYVLLFRHTANGAQIIDKKNHEGKVLTRFWATDFLRNHLMFEAFHKLEPIAGAAVVKEKKLLHAIGLLPELTSPGQSQLDAVLAASNGAVQRPSMEFVENNEVLHGLHQFAIGDKAHKNAYVLLFARAEGGSITVASIKTGTRVPLEEFKVARIIHQTFAASSLAKELCGASVIAEGAKPHVVAAFGRTPLKESMLAVPENFKRLGIPLQ